LGKTEKGQRAPHRSGKPRHNKETNEKKILFPFPENPRSRARKNGVIVPETYCQSKISSLTMTNGGCRHGNATLAGTGMPFGGYGNSFVFFQAFSQHFDHPNKR
jgi:hypothetical protein